MHIVQHGERSNIVHIRIDVHISNDPRLCMRVSEYQEGDKQKNYFHDCEDKTGRD
jgi:hypothetical protein